MSRHLRRLCGRSGPGRIIWAVLALALLLPGTALAGVIDVDGDTYSLDGGKPVEGAWEIAEKIAVAKDVAIIVMGKNAKPTIVQTMLQLLESLHVPTLLIKKADFKALVERGVIKPTRAP